MKSITSTNTSINKKIIIILSPVVISIMFMICSTIMNSKSVDTSKCSLLEDYSRNFFYKGYQIQNTDAYTPGVEKYYDVDNEYIGYCKVGVTHCNNMYFNAKDEFLGFTVIKDKKIYRFNKDNKQVGYVYISTVQTKSYNDKGDLINTNTHTFKEGNGDN